MAIPGFTAETSLYKTTEHYKMAGAVGVLPGSAAVMPQQCVNLGPCRACLSFRPFSPQACLTFSCLGLSRRFCLP
jgi:hypothetical protein